MIKNWTVVTQPVRYGAQGIACRERYITSTKHPNHVNTTEIFSLIGNEQTSKYIALIGEQYRLRQQMGHKAGRHLSSYAMEYCLTLPKGIELSNEQWKDIISYCCKSIFQICNLTNEDEFYFKKNIRAVIHRQNQKNKMGSGDHIHLIVGKVLGGKNTRILKELQQKKVTRALKTSFNIAVLKYAGLNYRDYTPSELNKSKKLETWKYHYNKKIENEKTIIKMQNQIDKWFIAYNERNSRQLNRQFNRLTKSYLMLDRSDQPNMSKIEDSIKTIEKLSNRKMIH
ncbi:hypothetical protein A9D46_12190 [Photobacterium damselae subsp. damselae]|uniref:hypothetical protein n=1 Tax=Photobacterium damselae TaxID=38293 RepID=UPI00084A4FF8|nr:hypothetical protein [Photobacterium damselae]OEC83165.1 hypothetical protein A9D46_12190 [Photobacterium damselae subsp. damselae]UKA09709.1 hypothetical protein IHC91_11965 [Photobacterium damselae subsp. damselae]